MKKGLVTLGVGLGALALFSVAIALRTSPSATPRKGKPGSATADEPEIRIAGGAAKVDAATQGRAMHDATLRNLIQSAKVAAQRKDEVTRKAMLDGLRKDAARSKALLEAEAARSTDAAEAAALRGLLEELP
jgi:hypothetical protein